MSVCCSLARNSCTSDEERDRHSSLLGVRFYVFQSPLLNFDPLVLRKANDVHDAARQSMAVGRTTKE